MSEEEATWVVADNFDFGSRIKIAAATAKEAAEKYAEEHAQEVIWDGDLTVVNVRRGDGNGEWLRFEVRTSVKFTFTAEQKT